MSEHNGILDVTYCIAINEILILTLLLGIIMSVIPEVSTECDADI